jgi:hypothetical protein
VQSVIVVYDIHYMNSFVLVLVSFLKSWVFIEMPAIIEAGGDLITHCLVPNAHILVKWSYVTFQLILYLEQFSRSSHGLVNGRNAGEVTAARVEHHMQSPVKLELQAFCLQRTFSEAEILIFTTA